MLQTKPQLVRTEDCVEVPNKHLRAIRSHLSFSIPQNNELVTPVEGIKHQFLLKSNYQTENRIVAHDYRKG